MEDELKKLQDRIELLEKALDEMNRNHRIFANKEVMDVELELISGLRLKRLPTTDTNLLVGQVYNSSGTLMIKQ